MHTRFWWGNLTERDNFEDTGRGGRIILKWIFKMWDTGMGLIALAHDRIRW